MNTVAATNQEEAATIAAESLSSLDNLPNEVQHLLAEIRHKETRSHELQQEITKITDRYFRHALRNINSKEAKENGKDKESKDSVIQARITNAYAELDQIANEKIALAARLVEALSRVSARLDHDLNKVMQLSGEQSQEQYEVRGGYVVGTLPGAPAPITLSANTSLSTPTPRSVREVQESLRATITNELVAGSPPLPSAVQGPQKRRRLNTGAAVASINASVSRAHTPQARSRLAQQVHPSPPPPPPPPPPVTSRSRRAPSPAADEDEEGDNDADADGDIDDQEESGDPEDKGLYCFCQKMSYGEMIGCDNDSCPYEWFHLGCVGLKAPLPEHWYCDECLKSLGAGGGGSRKGRRKAQ